ncbi:hypothetical protein ACT7DF_23020 [Bacillus cereus]
MKLILGDKTNETLRLIYKYLTNNKNEHVVWLDAQDIKNELVIHDSITEKGVTVRWSYRDKEISPECTSVIINYLVYPGVSLFNDFAEADSEYAFCEFYSYLVFAIGQFKNVLNPPWGGSLSGYCHSLPYQWKYVEQNHRNIKIPLAFFGLIKDAPNALISGYNIIASDNPLDGRYWKTGISKKLVSDDYYLFYQRPRGTPFVVTALDNKMWVKSLAEPICLTQHLEKVSFLCHSLMNHFHIRLAEILFFFDEHANIYTFGSISPSIEFKNIPKGNISDF